MFLEENQHLRSDIVAAHRLHKHLAQIEGIDSVNVPSTGLCHRLKRITSFSIMVETLDDGFDVGSAFYPWSSHGMCS